MLKALLRTENRPTSILIRIMVGAVFLSEGFQKYIFPNLKGEGLFAQLGLPAPEFLGYLVGAFEISCGLLVIIGLLTRMASVPLIVIMLTAINFTKIPILLDAGLWKMLTEVRTEFSMLLGAIWLLIEGGGKWSMDRYLLHRLSDEFFDKARLSPAGASADHPEFESIR